VHTSVGLAIGVAGALLVGRAIRAQLYGVGGVDAAPLGTAVVAMALCAVLAASLPARRAASISPATALRGE
jgi:ABC-type antimicrobial peptide transport system permease subunit